MEQSSRRDFLRTGLLSVAGVSLLSGELLAAPKKPARHIGLQLYSVRDDIKKDAVGTIEKVAKIGYKEVEGFGYADGKFFGLSPEEYSKVLKGNGLTMPSAHSMVFLKDFDKSTKQFSDSFKKSVEDAAKVGQKYYICPYTIDPDRSKGKELAELFNYAGELTKKHGMKFGYHNHDFEFKDYNGETLYETLLNNTDKNLVTFEMDLYWVVAAGKKPVDIFQKHPGRFTHVHVKDHDPVKNQTVEVGEGDINFQEIFNKKDLGGVKYFIVELEQYKRTPLEGIEIGYNNLKKLKF